MIGMQENMTVQNHDHRDDDRRFGMDFSIGLGVVLISALAFIAALA
jgi:hypothetical protein